MRRSFRLTAIFVAALTVVGASALAAWSAERNSELGRPAEKPIRPQPLAQQENPNHRALGVLRAERTSDDRMPDDLRGAVHNAGLLGENPSLARKALETAFGRTYYVVPGNDDVVCLVAETGSSICGPVEGALTAELGGTQACAPNDPSKYIVWGMVPDAAKQPQVLFGDGRVEQLRAPENVYAFTVERTAPPPIKLRWHNESQVIEAPVPVDSGVRSVTCGPL